MAASEYLSTRTEETHKEPVRAAIYTGIAYIITVTLLVLQALFLVARMHVWEIRAAVRFFLVFCFIIIVFFLLIF